MININAVLSLNGEKIVPVRAIPFVSGGDMNPRYLAGILSEPKHCFLAFVLGPNDLVTQMLPKTWKQYQDQLAVIATDANNLDLVNRTTLNVLPASTFVYWEALWRTHEALFLPSREEIYESPPEEHGNYELQPIANIPRALDELVFEGFIDRPKIKPVSRTAAQDQEIIALLKGKGFSPDSLPKNDPGKPGVKAVIRDALGKGEMWSGTTVFDKAWERLLKNGDIAMAT